MLREYHKVKAIIHDFKQAHELSHLFSLIIQVQEESHIPSEWKQGCNVVRSCTLVGSGSHTLCFSALAPPRAEVHLEEGPGVGELSLSGVKKLLADAAGGNFSQFSASGALLDMPILLLKRW